MAVKKNAAADAAKVEKKVEAVKEAAVEKKAPAKAAAKKAPAKKAAAKPAAKKAPAKKAAVKKETGDKVVLQGPLGVERGCLPSLGEVLDGLSFLVFHRSGLRGRPAHENIPLAGVAITGKPGRLVHGELLIGHYPFSAIGIEIDPVCCRGPGIYRDRQSEKGKENRKGGVP